MIPEEDSPVVTSWRDSRVLELKLRCWAENWDQSKSPEPAAVTFLDRSEVGKLIIQLQQFLALEPNTK